MRKIAFILSILGIFILLLLLFHYPAKEISTKEELSRLLPNQKVIVSGKILSEKTYSSSKSFLLDNNLMLFCGLPCSFSPAQSKNVSVLGIVENYNSENSIKILKIIKE